MAAPGIENAIAIAGLDAMVDLVDGGAGAGKLIIYTGSNPTDPSAVHAGAVLAEITLAQPAFGNAADNTGKATATASGMPKEDSAANADGTAGSFRIVDSNNTTIFQGDVSTAAAGTGDLQLNSTTISQNATVSVTSLTVSLSET